MDTYEKKYNEALKWMRELYPGLHGATKEDAEHYFPELTESEDEKFRKYILRGCKECVEANDKGLELSMDTTKKLLAYLEKQKDNKDELVYRLNGLMQDYIKECKDDEEKEHRLKCYRLFWDALQDANFFEQKEQKPAELTPLATLLSNYLKNDFEYFATKKWDEKKWNEVMNIQASELLRTAKNELEQEQKPAWSEEDEKMLRTIISDGSRCVELDSKQIAWLKSLRPQSKDEIYKEKDEAFKLGKHQLAIKFMNYLDENRPEGKMSLSNGECEDINKAFKENDWAKIMRYVEKYRPSWKPSEEQMDALHTAVYLEEMQFYGGLKDKLRVLYEQLKRLM